MSFTHDDKICIQIENAQVECIQAQLDSILWPSTGNPIQNIERFLSFKINAYTHSYNASFIYHLVIIMMMNQHLLLQIFNYAEPNTFG